MSIYDFIENVVQSMRTSAKIMDVTDNGDGTFDIQLSRVASIFNCSPLNIVVNSYLTFSGDGKTDLEFKVESVSSKTITISQTTGFNFSGYTDAQSNKPYFSKEKWIGEANFLSQAAKEPFYANQRFPRFFLLLNTDRSGGNNPLYETYNSLTIFLLQRTDPTYRAKSRFDNVYEPTLDKLKEVFRHKLESNRNYYENENYSFDSEDLPYLGTEDRNQNKLNQIVDAVRIDITNLTISNRKNTQCKTVNKIFSPNN